MKTLETKEMYLTPRIDLFEVEMEQFVAASETDSMGGIDPFENNDLIDELTGII